MLLTKYQLPILSGLFIGTSYIPLPPWALLFCMVPLWLFWINPQRSLKEILIGGWVTQFLLTLIGFHWVAYTIHEFGGFPWPVSIVLLILFAALAHLYIPLAGALWFFARKITGFGLAYALISLALISALAEALWPSMFSWNLGYPLIWAKIPLYQTADIFGFQGLSTFVFLFNAGLTGLWLVRSQPALAKKLAFGLVAIFALGNLWGVTRTSPWQSPDQSLSVLQVQGNIGNLLKQQAERGAGYQQHISEVYMRLTHEGLGQNPDTELIIWPETAFPHFLDDEYRHSQYPRQLRSFVKRIGVPLFTGAYSRDSQDENIKGPRRNYNASFLFDEKGKLVEPPYRKTHLLAFGEYFPGREWVPAVEEWFPMVSNFGRGQGPSVFTMGDLKLGPQICYEGLYPDFSQDLSLKGAQIFVNLTNDSWFGKPFEPYQHLYMTFARAIENRRPLIRNTNTGISTVILADGEILSKSPIGEEWTGSYEVNYHSKPSLTFYTQYGRWWIPLWFVLLLGTLALGGYRGRISQP